MLLPQNTTLRLSFLPSSAIVLSLAMWLAKVVTMIPFPLLSTSSNTSSSIFLATSSLGVFLWSLA